MSYAYNIVRDLVPANAEAPETICRCGRCGRVCTRTRSQAAGQSVQASLACPHCWSFRIDTDPFRQRRR